MAEIISSAVGDPEFIAFLQEAMHVELSNMAELREGASLFPIEDIGVAQGNSLSSLLGNIALAEFDSVMNQGDCKCIRYIDDFIILAPTAKAGNARLNLAAKQLAKMKMELSPEKSSKLSYGIEKGITFLGIEILPGIIRPGKKAQEKLLSSIREEFLTSKKVFENAKKGNAVEKARSLVTTLKRVDGMIEAWGKHYWFCNDQIAFSNVDSKISEMISSYLGAYAHARDTLGAEQKRSLLGVAELSQMNRSPFSYPGKA